MLTCMMVAVLALGQTTQPAVRVGVATRPAVERRLPVRRPNAAEAPTAVARPATRPAVTAASPRIRVIPPATRPTGQPALAGREGLTRPGGAAPALRGGIPGVTAVNQPLLRVPSTQPATVTEVGTLSGDLVDVQATTDNNVIISGNEQDLAILRSLIEALDSQQPGLKPSFQIFNLQHAQARDLATGVQDLWTRAKTSATGRLRPEDKVTIIPDPRSNLLMVATSQDNMEEIRGIVEQLDQPALGREVKFTPIQLVHIKAAEAELIIKDLLKTLQQQRGVSGDMFNIRSDVRSNRLFVAAPEQDLEQIRHLVELIDVAPTPESGGVVKVAIYPLTKAVARDLAESLNEMLQVDTDAAKAMEEQIRRLQVVLKTRGGDEKALPDLNLEKPIRIMAEEGTNSIIAASVETNLEALGEIIHLLDAVPVADEMLVKLFPLKHADAETLAGNLQDMFDKGQNLGDQPGRDVPGRIPQGLPGEALAYQIAISSDVRTNTLVVAGRAEQLLLAEKVISSVDIPQSVNRFPPRMVALEHADVQRIQTIVEELATQREEIAKRLSPMEQDAQRILVVPDERTNSLIIIASDENFAEVQDLARKLDSADDKWLGEIRIVSLKEPLAATDIADKIENLWERRAEQRRQGGLPEDSPVIVTDSRSNSLVIASNREDYEAIVKVIEQLGQQPLSPMQDIRQIVLKHNDATKLADIIGNLFDNRLKNSLGEGDQEQPSDRVFLVPDAVTNNLLVVSSKGNYDEIVRLVTQLDVPPSVDATLRAFSVRNVDVTKAADMLRELFDQGVYRGAGPQELPESQKQVTVIPDVRGSTLLVSASPENLAIVDTLIKEIDRVDTPINAADARFVPIRNADVVSVADLLDQLFEGMRSTLGTESDQLELTVIPDTRSNVLVLSGSRLAMKRAEELIPQLDTPLDRSAYETRVYRLKQASASRLEPLLTQIFEERTGGGGQQAERTPIVIIPDDGSNSLVVSASRDDHSEVENLLNKLDLSSSISRQMEIIPLQAARAEQLADTLTELMQAQQGDAEGGFAVTPEPRTNSLVIFAAPDLMANVREIINRLDNTSPKTELALRVFRLQNANAEDLSQLLEDFFEAAGAGTGDDVRQLIIKFSPVDPETGQPAIDPTSGEAMMRTLVHQDVTIRPDTYTNSLMVMAPADHIDMLSMLIKMLDSIEPRTAKIRAFELRNADAEEMQQLLEDLFESGQGQDGEGRTLILGEGAGAAGGSAGGGGGETEVAFSVDPRTNTLIAAGSPAHLRVIEGLVYRLDDQEIEERVVRVVPLQYAEAEDVAGTLTSFFENEASAVEQAEEGAAKVRQLQRQVTIQDGGEAANTLLLTYSPRMEGQLVAMIKELDRPPPQVMIQVLMAEVTLDDSFELGMEFALQDLLFSEKAYLGPNGTVQGDNFDFIGGTDVGAAGSGSGVSFTVTGEDFNFLLHALQAEGRLEVLSRPSILVQDNQEANITVGERVPTVQDVVVSGVGNVTPSVTYEEVGIILDVKPIINPDGFVNMSIQPEISAIGSSSVPIATGVTLPTFTERKADTSVTVKDGETIIIGGLITSRTNDGETKVPIAGDIPLLGNLFRATRRNTVKTELLIVLTPHVIHDQQDARAISEQMRDQTGLIDDTRKSPLMQGLQVLPEDEHLGTGLEGDDEKPAEKAPEATGNEQGPVLEEFGPPTTSIEFGPSRDAVAMKQ